MDSAAIATKLESLYPTPSLHLDTGLHQALGPTIGKIGRPLSGIFMPRIARDVLLESSVAWFRAAREAAFGMTLDEMERTRGGEQAWEAAEPGFEELKQFMREHKRDEGPFVLGSQVSYVDFVIAALIEACRRIGSDMYERFIGYDESFRALHEACQPWMQDDQ